MQQILNWFRGWADTGCSSPVSLHAQSLTKGIGAVNTSDYDPHQLYLSHQQPFDASVLKPWARKMGAARLYLKTT